MTIKKRLFWSNILMILVPVVSTALIGILCVGFIWLSLINGAGIGIHDQEDFERACLAITETVEHNLENGSDLSSIQPLLDSNGMSILVTSDEQSVFTYGGQDSNDSSLRSATEFLDNDATVTQNGRSLYIHREVINEVEYEIMLFSGNAHEMVYSDLKVALVLAAIIIVFAIFISIFLTNRFLTKFVFRRIEEPLDVLTSGVKEIGDGNLDYRIEYDHQDEFTPVCTAFNEMAERLKASVERTRQDEESRKELLAGISHDLRSPLTCIQAYVEGLLDGVASTPTAQRQYLTTIKTKAEDIDRLVSQLFLFSKLDMDEYPMEIQSFRLDEAAVMLVQETRDEYQSRGLELTITSEPVTVAADPEQLRRVLTNIMDNSAKYKTATVGHLEINVEDAGDTGTITLSDDGPGVPEEALPKLFDAFYRNDPARKNPAGGSGLGLAIAAKTIQKMGGTISAANGADGGLTIAIKLPKGATDRAENSDH